MKWLLVYFLFGPNGTTSNMIEFDSKALCEQRGIALLKFVADTKGAAKVICKNPDSGEEFEVKIR